MAHRAKRGGVSVRRHEKTWANLVQAIIKAGAHKGRGVCSLADYDRIRQIAVSMSYDYKMPLDEIIEQAKAEARGLATA